MTKITFELDGKQVEAKPGETIWQVAKRQGREIPHLCYSPAPDYRPDGNCRACMVEIEGERVLAASCKRTPSVGMKVKTESARAVSAQKMVMELLVADQPARETSHDPDSKFWHWAETTGVTESRFPRRRALGDRRQPSGDACQPRRLHPVRPLRARLPRGPGQRRHRYGVSQPWLEDRVRLRRSHGGVHLRCLRRVRAGLPDRCADAGRHAG
ncbi:putative molibdopterin-dependent oxidoreductase YjgC [Bradyrhizobium japonicum]|nr:putative molibdopterin-dependent oxidoreductase YjgC [Bradyrhizobium japonicum]